ncbi:MAG: FmdB family zinc ribbon protein [Candidatus Limnocylindrales bacterium]
MPVYEYECANGHRVEVIQRIDAPGPVRCEICGAALHKLLARPAIVFKGSGWAKKDARAAAGRAGSGGTSAVQDGEHGHDEPGSKAADEGAGDRAAEPAAAAAAAAAGPGAPDAKPGGRGQAHDAGGATADHGGQDPSARGASRSPGAGRGSDERGSKAVRADRARRDGPGGPA